MRWGRTGERYQEEIARRMGRDLYERRLRMEDDRIAEFGQFLTTKFTFFKRNLIRPAQTALLKALGLWERGRRNFRDVRLERNEIPLPGLPAALDGFSILQLTDLHIDMDPAMADIVSDLVRDIRCDVCVLTGDYKNLTVGPEAESVRLMTGLIPRLPQPLFGVLGNHDYANMVLPFEKAGCRMLLNENAVLEQDGAKLLIAGVDDPSIYGTCDFDAALRGAPADAAVKILLAHSPTVFRQARDAGFDLLLAGHMHGGQVCLPGGRLLLRNDHFRCPRRLLKGAWEWEGLHGYTSRGTGGCGLPVRFNCPPEATLHVLRKG